MQVTNVEGSMQLQSNESTGEGKGTSDFAVSNNDGLKRQTTELRMYEKHAGECAYFYKC